MGEDFENKIKCLGCKEPLPNSFRDKCFDCLKHDLEVIRDSIVIEQPIEEEIIIEKPKKIYKDSIIGISYNPKDLKVKK